MGLYLLCWISSLRSWQGTYPLTPGATAQSHTTIIAEASHVVWNWCVLGQPAVDELGVDRNPKNVATHLHSYPRWDHPMALDSVATRSRQFPHALSSRRVFLACADLATTWNRSFLSEDPRLSPRSISAYLYIHARQSSIDRSTIRRWKLLGWHLRIIWICWGPWMLESCFSYDWWCQQNFQQSAPSRW